MLNVKVYFYYLSLCHCVVIGRSIGLHSTMGPLFDCGPITEIVFSSRNRSISFPYEANFDRYETNFPLCFILINYAFNIGLDLLLSLQETQ